MFFFFNFVSSLFSFFFCSKLFFSRFHAFIFCINYFIESTVMCNCWIIQAPHMMNVDKEIDIYKIQNRCSGKYLQIKPMNSTTNKFAINTRGKEWKYCHGKKVSSLISIFFYFRRRTNNKFMLRFS